MQRIATIVSVAVMLVAIATGRVGAHKPITSPFTYGTDVRPILQERCGRCHAPGGVAPMSLLTHVDAVPWGESMRGELLAGHMPPWSVDRGAARFRNAGGITGRELNVLLTWLTGGTPPGDVVATNASVVAPVWVLGPPDSVLPLPTVTLGSDEQERVAEFVLPGATTARALRAIDLLPGTPAIVRSATIEVMGSNSRLPVRDERTLSLWVPGDEAVPLKVGALKVPAGRDLVVRVRYRKTWEYERKQMTDQSRIGLYFAAQPEATLRAVSLSPGSPVTLSRAARALAVYPGTGLADTGVIVTATKPGGQREEVIAFHPRRGWARRFWLREPMSLPVGTHLSVRLVPESPALLPPGFTRPATRSANAADAGVTINIVE